jgi:hypothetical protein
MNYSKKIFILFILYSFFISCSKNPLEVSPMDKKLPINFVNLDSVFKNTSRERFEEVVFKLPLNKSQVLSYELNHCLGVGNLRDSGTANRIHLFLTDPFISRLENRIDEKFVGLDQQKRMILSGFLFLNHHFPKGKLPSNIVFMNSFFASNVFCTENEIAVGLERYLGPETDVIKELPAQDFFQWVKDRMRLEFLERDVLTAWIMTHYVPENKENIAAAIVNWGKIIYLTEASFPNMEPHLLLRYSKKDFEWSLKNEYPFWKYLVQQKLLFSKNERDMANFLNDAPFTIGLPEKGPDRLGQFLGWRMIHAYMKDNPETSLEGLVKTSYTKILQAYDVE